MQFLRLSYISRLIKKFPSFQEMASFNFNRRSGGRRGRKKVVSFGTTVCPTYQQEDPTTALNQSSTCRTYPGLEKVLPFLLPIVFFFFFSRGLNIASNLFSCLFGQHSEYHHQRHGNKKQLSVYNVINNSGNCGTSSEYLPRDTYTLRISKWCYSITYAYEFIFLLENFGQCFFNKQNLASICSHQ